MDVCKTTWWETFDRYLRFFKVSMPPWPVFYCTILGLCNLCNLQYKHPESVKTKCRWTILVHQLNYNWKYLRVHCKAQVLLGHYSVENTLEIQHKSMFASFRGIQRAPFHVQNLHFIWIIAGRFFTLMHFECGEEEKKEESIPIFFLFYLIVFPRLLWKLSASEGFGTLSTCCRVFLGRHDPGRSLEGTQGGEGCESRRPRWCERRPPKRYQSAHTFLWSDNFIWEKNTWLLKQESVTNKWIKSKVREFKNPTQTV